MHHKSFQHRSLILLASSALALLVCSETLTSSEAFASLATPLTREELALKNKLQREQHYSPEAALAEVLKRRSQSSGGAGSVSNEEKIALEKKIEEAQRLQQEQEKQLVAQKEQAQKLQLEKEKAEKERLQFEAEQKILAEQIAQQRAEHEKALKELEEKHFKLTAAAKKKTAELEQELKLAAEASEFRGFDYLNKRLSVVDTRIKTLERMVTPDQQDMKEFIDQSKDALAKLTAAASSVDIGTDKEILLDLQKNISVFSFNFEIEALDFLSRNAAKAGIALPDSFYDMSPEQQEAAINEAKKIIENKIKEAQQAEEKRAANERLLRAKLKERAAEELEIMKKEIGDTSYLVKAATGTGILLADLKKMEQYAHADDYDKINYQTLQDREREIGTILEQGKGSNGSIIDAFRKKINDLHAAQHPDNVTQEQIAFAEALYFMLPGKAMAMGGIGGGMLPPPPPPVQQNSGSPASSSSGGFTPPPPPPPQPSSPPPPPPGIPSGKSGPQVKKIPEGGNYKALYETRLKPYLIPLPGMPGLLGASPEEIKKYIDLVIKNAKTKLQLLQEFVGTIKVTGEKEHETVSLEGGKPEIIADIKKIMDGTIEPEKLYGYYLMLSALKSQTKLEDIQLKWQKDDRSNLRSLRSFINYVKTKVVEDEIQKASNAGSGPGTAPKVGSNSVPKNDIFAHLADIGELWVKDPDLLKIASGKDAESLDESEGGFKKIVTLINKFIATSYGVNNLKNVNAMIVGIPVQDSDTPNSLVAKLKNALAAYIENLSVGGQELKTLKGQQAPNLLKLVGSKNVVSDDYKHLMILLSHFLDDPRFIAELSNVEEELKNLHIKSSGDLNQRLLGILGHDINTITHGDFYMDTISEETRTKNDNSANAKAVNIVSSIDYRFDIPNNVFTSQEINSKFDALYKDLGEYQDEYNKLYEDYTSGRSILAPSINLLAITKPKVKLILEKLEKTLITMDEKTISQILNAINDVSRALSQNKAFSEMIKKLQTDYPKLVKTRRVSDIANLVEQAVDTVQLIDMKTVIPPEKQGRNVPYTYLKTFLVLKTLTLTSWQVEEAQPQAPVSSSGGGHASSSQPSSSGAQPSSSSGQPSTDISQIKAMPFDALIAKHGELQKEIDDQKTPSASHGDLVNEAAKYRIEIEKRQRPSEFQFWKIDEHNKEVIPLAKNMEVIVLLRKTGEHLQPDEEHNIVEFMKEIKPIQKLKSVYTNNLVKIQKYQPHLVAQIQQ